MGTGTITGRVLDGDTNQPILGAGVFADDGAGSTGSSNSIADGTFSVSVCIPDTTTNAVVGFWSNGTDPANLHRNEVLSTNFFVNNTTECFGSIIDSFWIRFICTSNCGGNMFSSNVRKVDVNRGGSATNQNLQGTVPNDYPTACNFALRVFVARDSGMTDIIMSQNFPNFGTVQV